jgi:hypothetical protein
MLGVLRSEKQGKLWSEHGWVELLACRLRNLRRKETKTKRQEHGGTGADKGKKEEKTEEAPVFPDLVTAIGDRLSQGLDKKDTAPTQMIPEACESPPCDKACIRLDQGVFPDHVCTAKSLKENTND